MAERLADGNVALALLTNTLATGAALVALIMAFFPISGAYLNPAVTLAARLRNVLSWRETGTYLFSQFVGNILGTFLAHAMFGREIYSLSQHPRAGISQLLSEFVATFGLLLVIWGFLKVNSILAVSLAVASYIIAAYWFTASTSFANPAVSSKVYNRWNFYSIIFNRLV